MNSATPDSPLDVYNVNMPRRRMQRGSLSVKGNWWVVRWWEDVWDARGVKKAARRSSIVGPAKGPGKLTKKAAETAAWNNILANVNAQAFVPQSVMTVRQFITQKFEPEHVWTKRKSGRYFYTWGFGKILPVLGDVRLRDLNYECVGAFLRGQVNKDQTNIQTVTHLKNILSALIQHAKKVGYFSGDNPARMVDLPPVRNKKKPALQEDMALAVLARLDEPWHSMALLSMTTSLNVAEIRGLTWKWMNLTDRPMIVGAEVLSPYSFAVVENYYARSRGPTKTGNRERKQPIPKQLIAPLQKLYRTTSFAGPDDPVFASKNGLPIDIQDWVRRKLKPIAKELGIPALSWHSFRRTAATLTGQTGMSKADRIALMGHGDSRMTDYYSDSDIERRRAYLDEIGERLTPDVKKLISDSVQVSGTPYIEGDLYAEILKPPKNFATDTVARVKEIEELKKLYEK